MKRPFVYLGFSYLFGLLVAFYMQISIFYVVSCSLLVVFLGLLVFRRRFTSLKICIVGVLIATLSMMSISTGNINYSDESHTIEATISDIRSVGDYGVTYNANIYSVDGVEIDSQKIILYSSTAFVYEFGDIYKGTATIATFEETNGMSYENSLKADGYVFSAFVTYQDIYEIIENENRSLYDNLLIFKQDIKTLINSNYSDDTADLLTAMVLGERDQLREDIYDSFINSGVSHILVVSGMHLSIITSILLVFASAFPVRRKFLYIIVVPCVLFYVVFTGIGQSVLRSAIMFLIILLADVLGEEVDSINSLGLAVFLICLFSPYSAVDMGFLLSVSATAGIVIILPLAMDKLKPPKRFTTTYYFAMTTVVVSVAAFLFASPLLLLMNGKINPLSIISSSLLAFPSTIFLTLGIISLVLFPIDIVSNISEFMTVIVEFMAEIMICLCEIISPVGEAIWSFKEGMETILFCGIILFVAIIYLFKTTKRTKLLAVASFAIMIISAYCISIFDMQSYRLIVTDSGNANFVFLLKDKEAVVIHADGYSSNSVKTILDYYQVRDIKYLFAQEDMTGMETFIQREFTVEETIITDYRGNLKIFEDVELNYLVSGELIELEINGVSIAISEDIDTNSDIKISDTNITINDKVIKGNYCLEFDEDLRIRRLD